MATIVQLLILVGLVWIIYIIVWHLAEKDTKDKKMKCPSCRSSNIIPETDALWSCIDCKALFSANSIL